MMAPRSSLTLTSLLLILLAPAVHDCAKIIAIPFPIYSHIQSVAFLRDELQRYGHELWIAYPSVMSARGVLNDRSFNFIKYESLNDLDPDKYWVKTVVDYYLDPDNFQSVIKGNWFLKHVDRLLRYIDPSHIPNEAFRGATVINDAVLRDTDLQETIKRHKFDLALIDSTVGMPLAIIPYILDIPFCFLGSFFDAWRAGVPSYPSFSPVIGMGTSDKMGFKERLKSTMQHLVLMTANPIIQESLVSQIAPEKPFVSMTTLFGKAGLWLIEQNSIVDFPRSSMPHTKFIGSLSVVKSEPLQGKFKTFYENSKHGVIVVSFGGSLKSLPKYVSDKLFKSFSLTKYDFVWRSNLTFMHNSKFLSSDWIPQNDLLGDPRTKLFITHCGSNSQFESVYNGVPMLGMPVYAEQHYNSRRMVVKKYGLAVDFLQATSEHIAKTINDVIDNPEYKINVVRASQIFKDNPLSPREEAAYWLNHVIKHGDSHFRSSGLDLSWYEFMCVDVMLFVFCLVCCLLLICCKCLSCCLNVFHSGHKDKIE